MSEIHVDSENQQAMVDKLKAQYEKAEKEVLGDQSHQEALNNALKAIHQRNATKDGIVPLKSHKVIVNPQNPAVTDLAASVLQMPKPGGAPAA